MSDFRKERPQIKDEPLQGREPKIVKFDGDIKRTVEAYQVPKIKEPGKGDYSALKAKYGPLAATDPDRGHRTQKDARFSLNPLVRDPLSIEEEEKRVIEEKVRSRVAAITEETKEKAYEAGYQDGFAKGREEAYAKFSAQGAERLARIEALLNAFEGAKTSVFLANERFLIEMVYRVSRMLMLKDLSTDRDYVLRLCRELIERVGVKDNIRIRLSPVDLEAIAMLREGLEAQFGQMNNLHIETSTTVQSGGVMFETEWNAIDATIDTQLEGLHQSLLGGLNEVEEQSQGSASRGSGFSGEESGSGE